MNAHVMVHFKSFSDWEQNNAVQQFVESKLSQKGSYSNSFKEFMVKLIYS